MKYRKPERARERRARAARERRAVLRYGPLFLTERQADEFVRLAVEPSVLLGTVREVPMNKAANGEAWVCA